MDQIQVKKFLNWGLIIVIGFSIFSQLYSLAHIKAFWLDEWFILYNVKFSSTAKLFDDLLYMQQFPRIYLILIKLLADATNYNYFALRVIPTSLQILNVCLLTFSIRKILFKGEALKGFVYVLFFLSFQVSIFYFSQLKQYTMEMLLSILALWYFYRFSNRFDKINVRSSFYAVFIAVVFCGSFFSYTFPIVLSPLLLSFLITFYSNFREKKIRLKACIPVVVFCLSLVLNYYTDLRFVLHSKGIYGYFDENIMSYHSLRSIAFGLYNVVRLFAYNFVYNPTSYNSVFSGLLFFVRLILIVLSFWGLFVVLKKQIRSFLDFKLLSFSKQPSLQIYFIVLFFATITLYFMKKLPLGEPRVNYYSYLFITYFLIVGLFDVCSKWKLIYVLLPLVVFASFFQIIRSGVREIQNKNLLFDQAVYDNVGRAITEAEKKKLLIVVSDNEFYPMSIMEHQEELIIKSHHLYKPQHPVRFFIHRNNTLDHLIDSVHAEQFILMRRCDFMLVSKNKAKPFK